MKIKKKSPCNPDCGGHWTHFVDDDITVWTHGTGCPFLVDIISKMVVAANTLGMKAE